MTGRSPQAHQEIAMSAQFLDFSSSKAATVSGTDAFVGVTPDFHHVPVTSSVALESYMHLYLESTALTESTLKSSIEHIAF
jgi:hypothetical protein